MSAGAPTLEAGAAARLEARGLGFAYTPGVPVLDSVSFEVAPGTLTGIAGPNGCGKSTLLRLLCGLLRPDAGQVLLGGRSLHRVSGRLRAQAIGYLPQSVDPAFALTAFEVVCLGRYPRAGAFGSLRAEDLEAAHRCMARTDTADFAHRPFDELSGGERQRVLLASVLAQEPRLLLLDEPTAALDVHHQTEVFALLARLARDGYGVAVVAHDLNLLGRHCGRIALLGADHRMHAQGPPGEVLREAPLAAAYGAPLYAGVHPLTGTPLVTAPVPEDSAR